MQNSFKRRDVVGSILFLTWFLVSVIALVTAAKKGITWLAIALFGQYFLVFGMAACIKLAKDGKLLRDSMIWSVVVLGFLTLSYGIDAIDGISRVRFLLLCGISITACGIIILAGPMLDVWLRRHRCTYRVRAYITEVKTSVNTRSTASGTKRVMLYCPVYEIEYRGKKWQLCDGHFDRQTTEKGQAADIFINPEDALDFYDPTRIRGFNIVYAIFSLCFIISGIALFYAAFM